MVIRLILLAYVSLCISSLNAVLYDCVTGKPANKTQLKIYAQRKNTQICTVDVKPCNPQEEWPRVDGSCNNLKYPSRGTHRTPTVRLLPFDFSTNYEPRKAADGGDLELARRLRTELLSTGKVSDMGITQLVSYYLLFSTGDINSIHDPLFYVMNLTTCCKPEGKDDYRCTPVVVPRDDPVHRYSGVTCMNLTRPLSFQSYKCLDNGTQFARIVFQTPVFDLSNTYNLVPGYTDQLRTFKNGLIKVEVENGLIFAPSDPKSILCLGNHPPRETRCNKYQTNNAVGPTWINLLFYRQHNVIAKKLFELNPSWNDERLFFTARDINIATSLQIFLYELLALVFGRKNMIKDGILSCDGGFRDLYDENIPPQMSDEYVYVNRWFHTIQETNMKMYDKDGCFTRSLPMVNFTSATGYFTVSDNLVQITQGSFRQPGAKADYIIDDDMGNRATGPGHFVLDVASLDLQKGRYFGFSGYTKYKEFCTKRSYKTFSDLKDHFSPERLYRLMHLYKHPSDIDLLGGIMAEKHVKGGMAPETVYCLMIEQLKRTMASDRYWYERPNRPHAFTEDQLKAIRKVTIAGMLCTVADGVTVIQPHAFRTISSKNPLTKCSSSKIGKLDLTPWKEDECK